MLPSFTSLIKTLRHFPKALTVTIFSTALFTDRGIGKGISDTGKVSRRMIFTLLNLLSDEKLKYLEFRLFKVLASFSLEFCNLDCLFENKGKDCSAQTPHTAFVVASHYRLQITFLFS